MQRPDQVWLHVGGQAELVTDDIVLSGECSVEFFEPLEINENTNNTNNHRKTE